MKKKYFFALIMILCCTFLLCGCASVSYTVIEGEDGSVGQIVEIELDTQQLASAGATSSQIQKMKTDIRNIMSNKQTQIVNSYVSQVQNDSSLTDSQKQMLVDGVEANVQIQDDTIYATFDFANVVVYYYFYDIDPNEDDSDQNISQKDDGLFYEQYIQTTKTIFSNQELVDSYVDLANQYIDSLNLSNPSKIKAPQYSYSYQTTNAKLKSDADYVGETDEGYVHTWFMTSDQTQREIHFYTRQPRRVVWYAFALGGALILVGVLFVVNFFKVKKQKKDEVEIIEP